jgi:hypothetical protein
VDYPVTVFKIMQLVISKSRHSDLPTRNFFYNVNQISYLLCIYKVTVSEWFGLEKTGACLNNVKTGFVTFGFTKRQGICIQT